MEADSNSSYPSVYDESGVRFMLLMVTSAPCCFFFVINSTILLVLGSKPAFYQCPRYVLLFNLVVADTVLIAQGQALFLLATYKIWISYPLCISLAMISYLTAQISPYTLIFMSLERCIAVCFPFRHSAMVSLKNTLFAILLIWTVSCFDVFIRVLLFLEFPFHKLPDMQMKQFCTAFIVQVSPKSRVYDAVYTYCLFSVSALVISSSFVAVMVVACLASGDRAQAEKTRNTLLLHLFQLGLNLLSVMNPHLYAAAAMCCGSIYMVVVVYVSVVLMPRFVSALAYGLRDSALRPALGKYLCCRLWLLVGEVQVKSLVLKGRHKAQL